MASAKKSKQCCLEIVCPPVSGQGNRRWTSRGMRRGSFAFFGTISETKCRARATQGSALRGSHKTSNIEENETTEESSEND